MGIRSRTAERRGRKDFAKGAKGFKKSSWMAFFCDLCVRLPEFRLSVCHFTGMGVVM